MNTCPSGTYLATNAYGRVITHEIGHHLGLLHLNSCSSTDYCNDTPPNGSMSGVPSCSASSYPLNVGSCTSPISNSPDGEMYMNFMSYSEDCAMYMFTHDQLNRITTAMTNSPYLNKLGAFSTGIKELSLNDPGIYPNPTNGKLVVTTKGQKLSLEIYNTIGDIILKKEIAEEKADIDLSAQPTGIYFVKAGSSVKKIIKE